MKGKGLKDRIDRWMTYLTSHYEFEILYRKGSENKIADFLSRYPSKVYMVNESRISIQPVEVKEG